MTVQSVVSATDGHRRSDPAFFGLAQDPEVQGRYFYQVAGRHLGVFPTLRYLPPHPDVILNTEGQADALCVLVEYWQAHALYLRRLMRQANGGANQCASFMTMYTLKRVQSTRCLPRLNLMLTTAHSGNTAGARQFRNHRNSVAIRHFRHICIA